MKTVTQLMLILALILSAFTVEAADIYDFEIDGICYKIIGTKEVEVSPKVKYDDLAKKNDYSGDIFIPDKLVITDQISGVSITFNVIRIGEHAFSYSKLGVLTISEGIEEISYSAFRNTTAKEIIMPSSLKTIGYAAFASADIEELKIPDGVIKIGTQAFISSSLKKINIPASVTTVGGSITENCNKLESLIYEDSMEELSASSTYEKLGDLPSKYLYIGRDLEELNTGWIKENPVWTIEFGENFTGINKNFFKNITFVDKIIMRGFTPPKAIKSSEKEVIASIRESIYENCTLYVPEGSLFDYQSTYLWGKFVNIKEYDPTNPPSSVREMESDKLKIYAINNNIIVEGVGLSEVIIYSIDGCLLYKGKSNHIEVPSVGIYIVRVGNHTAKVIVK